jgi:hypothetical protein
LKLFVIAALSAAFWAAPTAAAQSESASDYDVSAAQNVSVTPDPAPAPAQVQPTPDPVPAPEPASTSPGGETAPPPAQSAPSEPATPAPEPAAPAPAPQPAPEPVVPDRPAAAASAGDAPVDDSRPQRSGRRNGRKAQPSEKDRSAPVDKANPLPVISEVAPLAEGLRDRAREAGPPIAVAALALLVLALTSGAFLLVATRRTGAWRT